MTAIQDLYPDDYSHCYGCGRLNAHGLHIKTEWTGEEGVAHFVPRPEHISIPGYVYGGLLASLIDCHGIATAAAATLKAAGKTPGRDPSPRFVTAALEVVYLKPTPMATELVIRGRPVKVEDRKVIIEATVTANGVDTVRGTVVAAPLPASMASRKSAT